MDLHNPTQGDCGEDPAGCTLQTFSTNEAVHLGGIVNPYLVVKFDDVDKQCVKVKDDPKLEDQDCDQAKFVVCDSDCAGDEKIFQLPGQKGSLLVLKHQNYTSTSSISVFSVFSGVEACPPKGYSFTVVDNKTFHKSYDVGTGDIGYCESRGLVPAVVKTDEDYQSLQKLLKEGTTCAHGKKTMEFGGKHYYRLDAKRIFKDSAKACKDMKDSKLASISTPADMENVINALGTISQRKAQAIES